MRIEGQNLTVYSVSEVNALARSLLEDSFPDLWIQGEVSGFKPYRSGHWYFSLKDEDAEIRCVMFRGDNQRVRLSPADGAQVRLRCRISLYEQRGNYQAIVRELQPAGEGELLAALAALRETLAREGLFAAEKKRAVPKFPRHLAIITSPSGAALRDIAKTLRTRGALFQCTLLPVAVQGTNASPEIQRAFKQLADWPTRFPEPRPDLVLLARGGGSLEDLWAFNLEPVVRAVANSPIPVITGIGHETDTSLSDLAADQRAATPTAAAALATPDYHQVGEQLSGLLRQFATQLVKQVQYLKRDRFGQWVDRLAARNPQRDVQQGLQRLDDYEQRLRSAFASLGKLQTRRLAEAKIGLKRIDPSPRIAQLQGTVTEFLTRMSSVQPRLLRERSTNFGALFARLEAVSPKGTLERGYAILARPAMDANLFGQPVTSVEQTQIGASLVAHLADGRLQVTLDQIHRTSS